MKDDSSNTLDVSLTYLESEFIKKLLSQITINAASEDAENVVHVVKEILKKITHSK